ncbi:hypothetical protein QAD02_002484 [Eretmocerus hayati]|uniref:Uncharacterized protein n=1 Tax=Eretmocerus hayati TaxID=131215 RepID=A0ACC2NJ80_9HYME|nr:hypothetical protein QAD02_002484 [Eretmocerus hayati]
MKGHIPEKHLNCILCNTGFPDKEDLQYHLIDQHKIRRQHIPPSEHRGTGGEREGWILARVEDHFGGQFSFSCPYCQLLLKSQDTLRYLCFCSHSEKIPSRKKPKSTWYSIGKEKDW